MADRPARKPSGLAEPETLSGEYRTRAFAAEHELREAQKKIAELEAERAQIEDRRRNVEVDILKGMTTNMRGIISAEVAAEVERAMANRPTPQFTLSVQTPPPGTGFRPVPLAPPILPPAVVGPPMAAPSLLGPPRPPVLSVTNEQQAVADFAASQKAEQRLKKLGILTVPVCGLLIAVVGSLGSYCSAAHAPVYSTQPVYVQPGQPAVLPPMVRPPISH